MWIEVGRVSADMQRFQIRDLQEDHQYMIRIFARNEVGLSEPLESEEPYKVLPMAGNYHFFFSVYRISFIEYSKFKNPFLFQSFFVFLLHYFRT